MHSPNATLVIAKTPTDKQFKTLINPANTYAQTIGTIKAAWVIKRPTGHLSTQVVSFPIYALELLSGNPVIPQ